MPTTISVTENGSAVDAGLSPRVIAQADGKYWITGNLIAPKLVSSTGAVEVTLDSDILNDIEGNDFQPFTFKGKQYAFATTYAAGSSTVTGCRAVFIDASNGWNNAVNMGEYPAEGLGTTRNTDRSTSIEVAVDGTNGIEMWVNSVKQGIAYYKHGTPETETPEQPEQPETPEQPEQPETPSVNEPTLTQVWEHTSGLPTATSTSLASTEAAYGTGFNGTVYSVNKADNTIYAWTKDQQKVAYANNENFTGVAITCDDAGNLLVNTGIYTSSATTWNIVAASNKAVTPITVTFPTDIASGYTYHVGRVVGNMLSSEGAYVYLTRSGVNKIACVKIVNGAIASVVSSDAINGVEATKVQTISYAHPSMETVAQINASSKPANCFYLRDRNQKNYYTTSATSFAAPSDVYLTDGGDVVTLSGKTYAMFPMGNGASAHGSAFSIVETSSKEVVAEEKNSVASVAYYQSLVFEKVSETKANIYQYYAGGKVAMYTFEIPGDLTAIESVDMEEVEAPVEYYNLQGVRVANPENGLFIKKQGNKVTKVIL